MQLELTDIDADQNSDKPVIAGYAPDDVDTDERKATLNEYLRDEWGAWTVHSVMTDDDITTPRDLLTGIQRHSDEIDHVVTARLTDISSSWRDIRDVVENITAGGATMHAVTDELVIDHGSDALKVINVAARVEGDEAAARELPPGDTGGEWTGRPPAGFTVEDGRLTPGPEYDRVRAAIRAADRGDMSKRQAADEAGCTRRTVTRAIEERRDLYELDDE